MQGRNEDEIRSCLTHEGKKQSEKKTTLKDFINDKKGSEFYSIKSR